jgi:hypothetical protein
MNGALRHYALEAAFQNMGIYPASWGQADGTTKPRDTRGDGWNDAIIQMGEKRIKIQGWLKSLNLNESQGQMITELLDAEWIMIYAFRDDIPINFMMNYDDYHEVKNLTIEQIESAYQYFKNNPNFENQGKWIENVYEKWDEKSN